QMEMYYLVCYNIDVFRRFVFESTFLKSFEVDSQVLERIKNDDIELLKFGFNWLKFSLFKEKTMHLKAEVLEQRKKDLADSKVK
ncbi:YkgJ family cysteine cluster protein, partial [Fibrobacterota bacterium]